MLLTAMLGWWGWLRGLNINMSILGSWACNPIIVRCSVVCSVVLVLSSERVVSVDQLSPHLNISFRLSSFLSFRAQSVAQCTLCELPSRAKHSRSQWTERENLNISHSHQHPATSPRYKQRQMEIVPKIFSCKVWSVHIFYPEIFKLQLVSN